MAPGAPATACRERRQRRYAQFQAPRSRPAQVRAGRPRCRRLPWRAPSPPYRECREETTQFQVDRRGEFETRPTGNAVSLEDEMLKVAEQPDGLPGRNRALHSRPRPDQDRARQGAERMARRGDSMDFLKSIAIAASGLRAQAGRMRVISENIANADSTATNPGADPFRRKIATFRSDLDRALDIQYGRPRPDSAPIRAISGSNTSLAIPLRTPTATSNIPTSIRSSK